MSTFVLSVTGSKLMKVCEAKGFAEVDDLLKLWVERCSCPGICMTEGCDFIVLAQPDEQEGKCEACGGDTVVSVLVLAGIAAE